MSCSRDLEVLFPEILWWFFQEPVVVFAGACGVFSRNPAVVFPESLWFFLGHCGFSWVIVVVFPDT